VWLPADGERWRAYLAGDLEETEADELVFSCPACAEREFAS
jgi:hypothetical protein